MFLMKTELFMAFHERRVHGDGSALTASEWPGRTTLDPHRPRLSLDTSVGLTSAEIKCTLSASHAVYPHPQAARGENQNLVRPQYEKQEEIVFN